jgi:hypothetical protein
MNSWSEEELALKEQMLRGESVVIELRTAGHPYLRDWAEEEGHLVYIGNFQFQGKRIWPQSKWGNKKYPVKKYVLDEAIRLYERDLLQVRHDLRESNGHELGGGRALGCWCKKRYGRCHGDVLARLANEA